MLRGNIFIDGQQLCVTSKSASRNIARGFCVERRAGAIQEQHGDDKLCAFHTAAGKEFDVSPGDLQSALSSETPRGSTRRTLGVARQTGIERRDDVCLSSTCVKRRAFDPGCVVVKSVLFVVVSLPLSWCLATRVPRSAIQRKNGDLKSTSSVGKPDRFSIEVSIDGSIAYPRNKPSTPHADFSILSPMTGFLSDTEPFAK